MPTLIANNTNQAPPPKMMEAPEASKADPKLAAEERSNEGAVEGIKEPPTLRRTMEIPAVVSQASICFLPFQEPSQEGVQVRGWLGKGKEPCQGDERRKRARWRQQQG